jgi:hypothetical protein
MIQGLGSVCVLIVIQICNIGFELMALTLLKLVVLEENSIAVKWNNFI